MPYYWSSLLKGKFWYPKYLNCIYSCTTLMPGTFKFSLALYKHGVTCTIVLNIFLKRKKEQSRSDIFFVKFTHEIHGDVTGNIIPASRRHHLHAVLLVVGVVGLPTAPFVEGLHGRPVRVDEIPLFLQVINPNEDSGEPRLVDVRGNQVVGSLVLGHAQRPSSPVAVKLGLLVALLLLHQQVNLIVCLAHAGDSCGGGQCWKVSTRISINQLTAHPDTASQIRRGTVTLLASDYTDKMRQKEGKRLYKINLPFFMNFSSVVSWATWMSISPMAFLSWLHSQGMPVKWYRYTQIKKLPNFNNYLNNFMKRPSVAALEKAVLQVTDRKLQPSLRCTIIWFSGVSGLVPSSSVHFLQIFSPE